MIKQQVNVVLYEEDDKNRQCIGQLINDNPNLKIICQDRDGESVMEFITTNPGKVDYIVASLDREDRKKGGLITAISQSNIRIPFTAMLDTVQSDDYIKGLVPVKIKH